MTVSFELSDEQKDLQRLAAEFARDVIRPGAPHHDETGEWPGAIMKQAWELGLKPAWLKCGNHSSMTPSPLPPKWMRAAHFTQWKTCRHTYWLAPQANLPNAPSPSPASG